MSDEKKRTLSDDEVHEHDRRQLENVLYAIEAPPLAKPSFTRVAWGFCLWFVWTLAATGLAGWVVSVLADNFTDGVSFQQGVSLVVIVMIVSWAVRVTQIGGKR